jgi:hypothetical protein
MSSVSSHYRETTTTHQVGSRVQSRMTTVVTTTTHGVNGDGVQATSASVLEAGEGCSRFSSGWGSRFDSRRAAVVAPSDGRTFAEIRAQCLKERRLFEDPDFPAKDSSIFFSRAPPRPFQWKRPGVSCYMRVGIDVVG